MSMKAQDVYAILNKRIEDGSDSGKVNDYNQLQNKPKINNVELFGNKSLNDLNILDTTLTEEGKAADAKATGDAINNTKQELTNVDKEIKQNIYNIDMNYANAIIRNEYANKDITIIQDTAENSKFNEIVAYGVTSQMIYNGVQLLSSEYNKEEVVQGITIKLENSIVTYVGIDLNAIPENIFMLVDLTGKLKTDTTYYLKSQTSITLLTFEIVGSDDEQQTIDGTTGYTVLGTEKSIQIKIALRSTLPSTLSQNQNKNSVIINIQDGILLTNKKSGKYEPYVGGVPSPSLEYQQAICNTTEDGYLNLNISGRNLFNYNDIQSQELLFDIDDSDPSYQTITIQSKAPGDGVYVDIPYEINSFMENAQTEYMLGCHGMDGSYSDMGFIIQARTNDDLHYSDIEIVKSSEMPSFPVNISVNSYFLDLETFEYCKTEKIRIILCPNFNDTIDESSNTNYATFTNVMFSYYDYDYDWNNKWEPYKDIQSIQISVPNGLNGSNGYESYSNKNNDIKPLENLSSLQKDVLDLINGKIYRAFKKVSLIGTPNFVEIELDQLFLQKIKLFNNKIQTLDENPFVGRKFFLWESAFQDDFVFSENQFATFGFCSIYGYGQLNVVLIEGKNLYFWPLKTMTAEEVNTVFINLIESDNPPQILAELKTPQIENLSEEEIESCKKLHTYNPTTILSTNQYVELSTSYKIDTKTYIDSMTKVAPTAKVKRYNNYVSITMGDATGTTYANVYDGKDGSPGPKGDKGDKGDKGESGVYGMIDHGSDDKIFELPPNQFHKWDTVDTLTLTLGSKTPDIVNEYMFSFISGSTPTTLSLPESIETDIVIEPNTYYECSIINNYMVFREWGVVLE